MAESKKIRSNGTYLLSTDKTDNPKLCGQVLAGGLDGLYLEYYDGYNKATGRVFRHTERLKGLLLYTKPRTPIERQQNKETLELAKKIRHERQEGRKLGLYGKKSSGRDFYGYFQDYINTYTKKDVRVLQMALNRFKSFISETVEYSGYKEQLKPEEITRDMIADFVEYLKQTSKGEGAHTIYQRFKKVINHMIEHDYLVKNPCKGITITIDSRAISKDILSPEEIQQLFRTHCPNENQDIRRAFAFSLYTGARYCDVKELKYSDVDYSNGWIKFEQRKTAGHSSSSVVTIPLSDSLKELIGKPDGSGPDSLIFPLPSNTMCLKALRHWTSKAGITKHITWHCARHSFATNILANGADIKTVQDLMGHSTVTYTQRYTRVIDSRKRAAIDSLPAMNIQELINNKQS